MTTSATQSIDPAAIDPEPRLGATLVDPLSHEEIHVVGLPEWTQYTVAVLGALGWENPIQVWVQDHGERSLVSVRIWEARPAGAEAARTAIDLLQVCQRTSGIPAPA